MKIVSSAFEGTIFVACFAAAVIRVGIAAAKAETGQSNSARISNVAPRRDAGGKILDAHDGCLHKFGNRFYLYGTAYGTTDGFGKSNRYCCYSSADLVTWKPEGELLHKPPEGVYYRPYVVYNAKTRKYVLWYNWYPTLWNGQYGVAMFHAQYLTVARFPIEWVNEP
ncbi:MAG: hypothetical protein ABSG86_19825 [Thermoguttaceae bacterium]|jgi:hypothetical protein